MFNIADDEKKNLVYKQKEKNLCILANLILLKHQPHFMISIDSLIIEI